MPTAAENQERLALAIAEGNYQKALVDKYASAVTSASSRVESVERMLAIAGKVLPPDDLSLEVAQAVAADEIRFWLGQYAGAAPRLAEAYRGIAEKQATIDAIQNELRPQLVELAAARKAKQGDVALGNPPGASPSLDLKV